MRGSLVLLSLVTMFWCQGLNAQYYSFTKSNEAYTEINGGINLFPFNWDDDIASVPLPFTFAFMGKYYDTLHVYSDGIPIFDMDWDKPVYVFALGADLERTSASSTITYTTEGIAPDRIFKLQLKNAGYYGYPSSNYINFQVWLFEGSNNLEIRYGKSAGNPADAFYEDLPMVGLIDFQLPKSYFLHGSPSNPLIDSSFNFSSFLNAVPDSSMVYSFGFIPSSPRLVEIISPEAGDFLVSGQEHVIKWTSILVEKVNIEYSTDNGSTWQLITSNLEKKNAYPWIVPHDYSQECKIKVTDADDNAHFIVSSGKFTIQKDFPKEINVYVPYGGQVFYANGFGDIVFYVSSNVEKVNIYYSIDGGVTWLEIVKDHLLSSTFEYYNWVVPNTPSNTCKIKIEDADDNIYFGLSDGFFEILPPQPPSIDIQFPYQGYVGYVGDDLAIYFTSTGIQAVDIFLSKDDGNSWTLLASDVPVFQIYYHLISANDISENCRIKVSSSNNASIFDISERFSIRPLPPPITVTNPNGNEIWEIGSTRYITWLVHDVYFADIYYSVNNGQNWIQIASNIPATQGSYEWIVPDNRSSNCRIKIANNWNPQIFDISDNTFSIDWSAGLIQKDDTPARIVVSPNPGTGIFTFSLPENQPSSVLNVYDVTGKVVYSQIVNDLEVTVDISALKKGVYYARLQNANMVHTAKLVLQ